MCILASFPSLRREKSSIPNVATQARWYVSLECTMRKHLLVLLLLLVPTTVYGQFQADIDRWVTQDAAHNMTSDAGVLFIGSSSIRRWQQLAHDFPEYDIIQRGFGGSQFSDVNRYLHDIVLPYDPRAIVIFEGTNEIQKWIISRELARNGLTLLELDDLLG